jgi:serine protease Do
MHPSRFRLLAGALFALGLTLLWTGHTPLAGEPKKSDDPKKSELKKTEPASEPLPPVFTRDQPESLEDLKAIETQVQTVLPRIMPAVVGVMMGPAQGSGVIVDKEGHVLTAGHVSGTPDNAKAIIVLPSGKKLTAKTLGKNGGIDSGMIQITEKGEFPYVELGKSGTLKKGDWVLAIGHPGGFKANRTPVVRVGRVLMANRFLIRTDCTLVGGDSGGPLFDMHGRVIGIHSRIGGSISENVHVPVDSFRQDWARLVKGESFGGNLGETAIVQSAGGKIVFEKKGTLTNKDQLDQKREGCFAQTHVLKMMPGFTYTIDMFTPLPAAQKLDPYLRLEDSKGIQLAEDDDGAGNLNARIVFRPTKEDEYRIIATTCDPSETGQYSLVVRQAEPKLLAGKVEVVPALHMHKQNLLSLLDQVSKVKGAGIFTSGYLFDEKGKVVPGKTIEFRWDNGKAQVKSDALGAVRLALTKKNLNNLIVDVPEGTKVALALTDIAGNVIELNPNFEAPKKKSAGGKLVLQEEGRLTEKEPLDKMRPDLVERKVGKACHFKTHTFKMLPGSTYTIDLESADFDAYLRLEDPDGKQIAEDDDSGGKLNSRIVFSPETEGVYRLIVTTCDPDQTGSYRLNIYQAENKKVVD